MGCRVNGRNIVGQQLPTLLDVYMLRPFAHPVTCCWMLLRVVAQQLPTFLLLHDRQSVAQQCWIRFHSFSNIVGAAHAHYAWFTKTYGLYPSHDALQVPTLLAQQCWKLLRPFARSLSNNDSSGNPVACTIAKNTCVLIKFIASITHLSM